MEQVLAQRCSRPRGDRGIQTHHRVAAAGALQGQLLGMTARSVPLGSAAARAGRDSLSEPMYELLWQVTSPADVVNPSAHHEVGRTAVSLGAHGGSAVPSMLAVLLAANAHGAAAVELLSTEQASALGRETDWQSNGATLGGALQAMLRAFAQESSAVVGALVADANAAGGNKSPAGSSLVLRNKHAGGISDGYGRRLTAGMTLSAVLLPSAMRSTPGAAGTQLFGSDKVRFHT